MSILPFSPDTTLISITMTDLSATEQAFLAKDKQIEALTTERDTALSENKAKDAKLLEANKTIADDQTVIAKHANTIIALQDQIKELQKPPVVIPPTPPPTSPQKITREFLPPFAGVTFEKGRASPSASLYSQVKTAMRWGRVQGLDTWRGFFNPQEVLDHQKPTPPLGNLPEYGRSIGYQHWIADTIDRILQLIPYDPKDPADTKLKAYMDGLEKMGAEGVMVNDANRKPSADDPGITFEQLKAIIARLTNVAPNMPIFVSLLGSADVSLYTALGVWVEIQTFGSVSELGTFLKKPVIMCLDLRRPLSAADLKTRADLTLKTPPKQFFFYADEVYDYDAMPDSEDLVVREFVKAWKALA